ncbi:MAG: bifunctional DNA-binding transcriptional regulator/O6-methylguanine-DNA methyltransferase Ada [Rhodospirillaceae bacterium]|nr:MAG: bifunctional DNA-binding transcriptional regulator/O6-methylguanine-DNA methyltransferase Ada [Rhodospirillaceae bacterium]
MAKIMNKNADRWKAVCDRDTSQNGVFIYGVKTTGIYCLPSCSSRQAKRENVDFYETTKQAEKAGFRACKRCLPDQFGASPQVDLIRKACEDLQNLETPPDLDSLAKAADLSPAHFQKVFKKIVGLSPKRYAMAVRKQRFLQGLNLSDSVTNAIYDAGYVSSSRAYADMTRGGVSPKSRQNGAKGEGIRFASAHSDLGDIIIGATARGICLVEFVQKGEGEELLRSRFPLADLKPADADLAVQAAQIVAQINHPTEGQNLPLDIRGTVFQERVWQALRDIPLGKTVSYGELATAIGQPTAARAVASAIAKNSLAVVVPCHRVVRGSGELSGYKWGVDLKQALLDLEKTTKKPAT